jgi:hypothetical protein
MVAADYRDDLARVTGEIAVTLRIRGRSRESTLTFPGIGVSGAAGAASRTTLA